MTRPSRIDGSPASHRRIRCWRVTYGWRVAWPTRQCPGWVVCRCEQRSFRAFAEAIALVARMDTALRAAHPRDEDNMTTDQLREAMAAAEPVEVVPGPPPVLWVGPGATITSTSGGGVAGFVAARSTE